MKALNERVASLDSEIAALSSQQTVYHHLLTIRCYPFCFQAEEEVLHGTIIPPVSSKARTALQTV